MKLWHIGIVLIMIVAGVGVVQNDGAITPAPVAAQDGTTCEQAAAAAMADAQQACGELVRGELCLGSDAVTAFAGGSDLGLASGDVVSLAELNVIMSLPADAAAEQWGLAMLNLSAGLPESSAGVKAVLFGDAQLARLEQIESDRPTLPVYNRGTAEVNLRNGAGITYALVGQLTAGEEAVANGRNEQGDWLRLQFSGGIAWVFTPLVDWDGDTSTLEVLPPNDVTPLFQSDEPFQTVMLATHADNQAACAEAPSGLLLQYTGTESASIQINQVTLSFSDATLLVSASADDALDVKVLSGSATVTARGVSQEADIGGAVRVNLGDADGLTPVGTPAGQQTYVFPEIAYTPLELLENPVACMVGLPEGAAEVQLHVGPGNNRGVIGAVSANASYAVLNWSTDPEGAAWWELDTGEQTSWVAQSDVRAIGACSTVAQVDPPPMVFSSAPPPAPSGEEGQVASDLAPAANSVWQMVPGSDNMSGECSGAPAINFCDHLAAIAPAGGGVSWKGMEPSPYYLTQIQPNVYAYAGPNVNGTGTVNMTLSFTSETTLKMTMSLVLSSEPECQHVYYYSGTRNW